MKVATLLLFFFVKMADVPVNKDPVATLQYLLGPLPQLKVSGHLLSVQLMSTNAYLHTSIMYGQWEGWDGKAFDQPPLFYNGLTEAAADLLSGMSDEVVKTAKVITENSGADMSEVSSACFIVIISFNLYPNSLWFLESLSSIFRDLTNNSVSH